MVRFTFGFFFRLRILDVLLFRHSLQEWKPSKLLPLVRHFRCEEVTVELVDRLFRDEPARRTQLRTFLETGAEGLIMYNSTGWIGYTWYIDLQKREDIWPNRSRHFTFVALPKGYPTEPVAYWCFSGEVIPKYRGKGVFLFLVDESYKRIRRKSSTAVIYSNTDLTNSPSIKAKQLIGESVVGHYQTVYLRLFGKHFGNILTTRLTSSQINEPSEEEAYTIPEQGVKS